MALQSPLVRYTGHQERGYEHRYGISASRFPGRLPAPVCLCCGPCRRNTLLPPPYGIDRDMRAGASSKGSPGLRGAPVFTERRDMNYVSVVVVRHAAAVMAAIEQHEG